MFEKQEDHKAITPRKIGSYPGNGTGKKFMGSEDDPVDVAPAEGTA